MRKLHHSFPLPLQKLKPTRRVTSDVVLGVFGLVHEVLVKSGAAAFSVIPSLDAAVRHPELENVEETRDKNHY
jgi:hypothetical protein